ncbi:LruC domain-containing protein [Pedobacter sp. MC2016-14]|uniref:LruC domain-containing protein n=1 Tax=Pedobacter sp. MC2016-14 TaxID=2897327 RepID=UPI001E2BF9ED|nr:LruC domain-containing protein [Pedobacter sp. MC2016-14]MCD0489813.1 LruC domain-containing protein [Pedobacter sp. MC2016-14]
MRKALLFAVLCSITAISSCKKGESLESITSKSIDEINVPANFDWGSSKDVSFSIGVDDNRFQNAIHVIKIYLGDPETNGQLLTKGSATSTAPFNTKIALPSSLTEVYVVKVAPDASTVTQKTTITSTMVSTGIGTVSKNSAVTTLKTNAVKTNALETSPDCTTGCGTIVTSSNSFDLNAGTTYCVTQDGLNVNIQNTNGGTLRVCAKNVTINGLKITSNVVFIVAAGGSVNLNNFNWDGGGTFKNFGTITMGELKVNRGTFLNQGTINASGNFVTSSNTTSENTNILNIGGQLTSDGTVTNSGTMTVNGTAAFQNSQSFTNTGTLTLKSQTTISGTFVNSSVFTVTSGEISFNSSPTVTNSGTFTATSSRLNTAGTFTNNGTVTLQTLQHNSSGTIINNCKFIVNSDAIVDKPIQNYSYFKIGGNLQLNGSGRINLFDAAMFQTNSLNTLDGLITGSGSTSLFKLLGSIDQNRVTDANNNPNGSAAKFSGTVSLYTTLTVPTGLFTSPAKKDNAIYIAKSDCNPDGNGTAPANLDTDGDGVPNAQDDYPNDATKAYNNYSINYTAGGSTVAFEDSWPSKGDYDLNDVVISYKYLVVTNRDNRVVNIAAEYKLLATGGDFQNGGGIQFNLPSGSATNFVGSTGTALESGQDSVVVILFNNSRNQQATWNTKISEAISPNVTYNISFNVTNGPLLSSFGVGTYNPFIWNGSAGYGRGYETHLYGKKPTKLANTALFGTRDDRSTSGKFYGTATKLPWAIEVPMATFKYPVEQTLITDAYLRFAAWAESGGTSYTDWYNNIGTGYRNDTKFFNK